MNWLAGSLFTWFRIPLNVLTWMMALAHRTLPGKLASLLEPAWARLYAQMAPPLDLDAIEPILILGNQKTGSTAIARLLAHYAQLSMAVDVPPAWKKEPQLVTGAQSVSSFVQEARYYFRRALVKENVLTLVTHALLKALPRARGVFVVRHPAHNIRSILDRLALPGRPLPFNAIDVSSPVWQRVVDSRWLGLRAQNDIASLAERWNHITSIYLQHRNRLHLIRYEDFAADKVGAIRRLAGHLALPDRQEIHSLIDVSFQPPGAHRSVQLSQFFTEEALQLINDRCAAGMQALGYERVLT